MLLIFCISYVHYVHYCTPSPGWTAHRDETGRRFLRHEERSSRRWDVVGGGSMAKLLTLLPGSDFLQCKVWWHAETIQFQPLMMRHMGATSL